jgi:hypothetical protein
MTPTIRGVFAFLSACGFAMSVFAYAGSFSGALVDTLFPWFAPLLLGWIVLFAPVYALEYPASRGASFFWKFAHGIPSWAAPCGMVLSLIGVAHLIWFGVHSGLGVPAILNGQYVIDTRGRILKVLTQAEYRSLRAAGLRAAATIMVSFYFAPMVYWWFRRSRKQVA